MRTAALFLPLKQERRAAHLARISAFTARTATYAFMWRPSSPPPSPSSYRSVTTTPSRINPPIGKDDRPNLRSHTPIWTWLFQTTRFKPVYLKNRHPGERKITRRRMGTARSDGTFYARTTRSDGKDLLDMVRSAGRPERVSIGAFLFCP